MVPDLSGPNGEHTADFGGIRDITLVGKDNLLSGGEIHPGVTGALGTNFPSGFVSKLTPRFLGQDAIGSGGSVSV